MSLHLSPATKAAPALKRLPETLLPKLQTYVDAKAEKKAADAASRNAEKTVKSHRAEIREAMDGSPTAICGHVVLTFKQGAAAAATVTLTNGTTIEWAKVAGVMVGNTLIPIAEIKTIYGGRSGSEDVEIAGL